MERVNRDGHGAHAAESVDFAARGREMLMMGLRLMEGVNLENFEKETNSSFSAFVNGEKARILEEEGLLQVSAATVAATAKGRQRLDAVLAYLLS